MQNVGVTSLSGKAEAMRREAENWDARAMGRRADRCSSLRTQRAERKHLTVSGWSKRRLNVR